MADSGFVSSFTATYGVLFYESMSFRKLSIRETIFSRFSREKKTGHFYRSFSPHLFFLNGSESLAFEIWVLAKIWNYFAFYTISNALIDYSTNVFAFTFLTSGDFVQW